MAKSDSGLFSKWYLRPAVALAIIVGVGLLTRGTNPSNAELEKLASQFKFERTVLPNLTGEPEKSVRQVNPSLATLSAWISSVGAAVAISDLSGSGMPNDLCVVDPRTDSVTIFPVPGTGDRYKPIVLKPDPLPYDVLTMAPMGCVPADMNEDGRMDVLVYYWGRTPVAYLWNGERFVPREVAQKVERWYTNAAVFADLDGSGHLALVLGNYFPDESSIIDASSNTKDFMQTSMARSFSGGSKRFFLFDNATAGQDANVVFKEVKGLFDHEVGHGWTLAIGAQDLNGDHLPELFFANDFGPDRFVLNESTKGHLRFRVMEGRGGFAIPPSKVMGRDSFKGMGVEFVDLNQSGVPTILVSNITTDYGLHESQQAFVAHNRTLDFSKGYVPYDDKSEELGLARRGWGWDIKAGDFNNSGYPQILQTVGFVKGTVNRWPDLQEFAMGNNTVMAYPDSWPKIMPGADVAGHRRNPFNVLLNGKYVDISDHIGIDEGAVSRGLAMADVDGDGRLDYAVANQWGDSSFYKNQSDVGSFIGLRLMLPVRQGEYDKVTSFNKMSSAGLLGRPAVGATARLHLPNGNVVAAQVDGGNGHSGKRSPDLHFGLGKDYKGEPIKVELSWRDPSGRIRSETQVFEKGWHVVMLPWSDAHKEVALK